MKPNGKYAKTIAKIWTDARFREAVYKNPEKVLQEQGMEIPRGQKIAIHENTGQVFHFVIPEPPKGELSMQELESIAAAGICLDMCGQIT